jgi:predicted negative regulator of RcsB-dependent stress response
VARSARIRRKDLKRPDEFLTLTSQALEWARANQRTLVVAGIAAVLIVVGVSGFIALRRARQRDANADLARALISYRDDKPSDAAKQLSEVSQRWPSTAAGEFAALVAADAELRAANAKAAIAGFESVLAAPELPPYLRQQAVLGYGAALEQQGQAKEALAKYSEAAETDGPYKAQAMLAAARVHDALGQHSEAVALYQKLQQDFPDVAKREGVELKLAAAR